MIIRKCLICQKPIKVSPCQLQTKKTCSRACDAIWRKQSGMYIGSKNPAYKGGTAIYTNGKNRFNGYSQRYILGQRKKIPEHKYIVEQVYGKLPPRAQIHHINGDSLDNRKSNLLICSASYHCWLHEEMARKYMQEHFTSEPSAP